MWGFSPALDLLEEYVRSGGRLSGRAVDILLVGSVDGRHVLKTLSCRKRHPPLDVNYHVFELAVELLARQMLLLTLALEPEDRLGPDEKSRVWMEIFGNTLLRPTTAKYLRQKTVDMVGLVTDRDYLRRRLPCLDLEALRYKERDRLEDVFRYWRTGGPSLAKLWDSNLRRTLGRRYDAKTGVFDWDYNMRLADVRDGKRVCLVEYKHWRNTGVAFTWLETAGSVSNPTLEVGIGRSRVGELSSLGYLGDLETGPYFAFGTRCEEEGMLSTRNGQPTRRATDITERHLQRIFHELQTGSPPTDLYTADREMGLLMSGFPHSYEEETPLDFVPDKTPEEYSPVPVSGQRVVFLPTDFLRTQLAKEKYRGLFDVVYVAQNYFKFISEDILRVLKPDCLVLVETRKFAIAYEKKIPDFGKEVREKMKELGGVEIKEASFTEDSHALFRVNLSSTETEGEVSSEDKVEVSSEDKVEVSSEDKVEVSSEDKGEVSSEDKVEVSSEDKGEVSSEDKGEVSSEDKVEVSSEDKGEVSSEDKGEVSSEDKVEVSSDDKVEVSSETNGELSSENKGEVSSETNGELYSETKSELSSENKSEGSSENKSEVSSENKSEVSSENKGEVSSETNGKLYSETKSELSSENKSEVSSENKSEVSSENQSEVSSENKGDVSSETNGELSSETKGELSSETKGEVSSENKGKVSSETTFELSSEKKGEVSSKIKDELSSETTFELSSETKGEVSSETKGEFRLETKGDFSWKDKESIPSSDDYFSLRSTKNNEEAEEEHLTSN